MTLLDIRKQLVQMSGRFELVTDTDTYEDDGANFYIQAAQRFLDSRVTMRKSAGEIKLSVEEDQQNILIPGLVSVEGVQVVDDESRVTLSHMTEQKINEQDLSESDASGCPLYYSLHTNLRQSSLGNTPQEYKKLAIKLYPIPDEDYVIYVFGRLSQHLEEDDDQNFWTINYPEVLITASLYQLEKFMRNTQGMNDYMRALQEDIRNLEGDAIESEIGSVNQMKDSFEFRGKGNVN